MAALAEGLLRVRNQILTLRREVKLDSGTAREVFGNLRSAAPAAPAQTREEPDVETHVHHEELASARDEAEAKVHPASPKKNKELKRRHVVSHRRRRH